MARKTDTRSSLPVRLDPLDRARLEAIAVFEVATLNETIRIMINKRYKELPLKKAPPKRSLSQ